MVRSVSCLVTAILLLGVMFMGGTLYGSEYDEGKALYGEKCMICHGADGKGNGPAAAALSPKPKDFNRPEFWKQKNVDQIITTQVKNGKGAMPAFNLSDNEIKEIIDYMSRAFNKAH